MISFELKFEAEQVHTTLHRRANYQMVGFSNFSYPMRSYLVLQKALEDKSCLQPSLWIEWNGQVTQAPIQKATLSFRQFTVQFNTTRIVVDLSAVTLDLKVLSCLESILGDLLEIQPLDGI